MTFQPITLDMLKKQLHQNGWEITRGCNEPIVLSFSIPYNYSFQTWSREILNNIFSCTEHKNGTKLYFDKIKSEEWETNLKNWVNNL